MGGVLILLAIVLLIIAAGLWLSATKETSAPERAEGNTGTPMRSKSNVIIKILIGIVILIALPFCFPFLLFALLIPASLLLPLIFSPIGLVIVIYLVYVGFQKKRYKLWKPFPFLYIMLVLHALLLIVMMMAAHEGPAPVLGAGFVWNSVYLVAALLCLAAIPLAVRVFREETEVTQMIAAGINLAVPVFLILLTFFNFFAK